MKTPKLFISYRRDGGEALAFLLNDRLKQKGYSVFYDIESLHAGKFDQKIFSEIEACDHFVLVLSVGALDRCVNENDWVRWEIAHALEHKKNIVPVMMRGFMFPENLPEEIAEISSINGVLFESMSLMDARIEQLITFFSPVESTAVSQNPILERAFMALEDGEWKQADDFCEQVLNTDPRNVQAYLFKLMAELRVRQKEDLAKLEKPFEDSPHYSKIVRFGDSHLKNEINTYIQKIQETKKRNEQIRLQNLYISTLKAMENARTENDYRKAAQSFSDLGSYKDSEAFLIKIRKQIEQIKEQCGIEEQHKLEEQCRLEDQCKLQKQWEQQRHFIKNIQSYISAGEYHTVGLKSDGTVVVVGDNHFDRGKVSAWRDIVAVSAGEYHTVGLKSDGTVIAVGSNAYGQCKVSVWRDIVAISAGREHTVGLKSDGTVIAVGSNAHGQCKVSVWRDIVAISAGREHTVGLKSDGTVIAVGSNGHGQCNVSEWHNIVSIFAGDLHTVGLKSNGTVVAVGVNYKGECEVSIWRDIVAISAGGEHTVGLKSDGTVVAVGRNYHGECEISAWRDIVAISAGMDYTVGLKSYGTVVAVGDNSYGQCKVSDWKLFKDIKTLDEDKKELWQGRGVCQYCGSKFEGVFKKRCTYCGRWKDY